MHAETSLTSILDDILDVKNRISLLHTSCKTRKCKLEREKKKKHTHTDTSTHLGIDTHILHIHI